MTTQSLTRTALQLTVPALSLLLSACATVSASDKQVTSSVTTEAAAPADTDAAALARWWERFDDPVLNELITTALAESPDIRTAASRIAESRAVRGTTKAGLFPTLSAGVSGSGSRTRDRVSNTTSTSESYGASLDASWEIDLFGQQRKTLAAADADLALTREDYHAAQVSLAAEVASTYITLRSTEANLALTRDTVATREQTLQLTQWRVQAGEDDALATRQATSSLEQARASIPSLELTVTQTRNQLALLCGRTPGSLNALLASTGQLPTIPADLADNIAADTLRQRPDVRSAEYAAQAAAARTSAAKRDRLPSLKLSGSIGVQALKAGNLPDPETILASVLGSLTAPIFDAGAIRNNIAAKAEQEKQALLAYESSVLTALSETSDALAAVVANSDRLAPLQKAADAARESERLANLQYRSGETDLLTLLDAQRTHLSVQQQLVSANADELTAHVQLYKALGGGWSPETADATASL